MKNFITTFVTTLLLICIQCSCLYAQKRNGDGRKLVKKIEMMSFNGREVFSEWHFGYYPNNKLKSLVYINYSDTIGWLKVGNIVKTINTNGYSTDEFKYSQVAFLNKSGYIEKIVEDNYEVGNGSEITEVSLVYNNGYVITERNDTYFRYDDGDNQKYYSESYDINYRYDKKGCPIRSFRQPYDKNENGGRNRNGYHRWLEVIYADSLKNDTNINLTNFEYYEDEVVYTLMSTEWGGKPSKCLPRQVNNSYKFTYDFDDKGNLTTIYRWMYSDKPSLICKITYVE